MVDFSSSSPLRRGLCFRELEKRCEDNNKNLGWEYTKSAKESQVLCVHAVISSQTLMFCTRVP